MDLGFRMHAERTPNPDSIKWVLGQTLTPDGVGAHFDAAPSAEVSPLAARLFEVDGVLGVFLASNFVTVTKRPELEWTDIAQPIVDAIDTVTMPVLIISASLAEHFEHAPRDGEPARDVDAR
jgi:hypothetical protein